MKVDENEVYTLRETNGKLVFASSDVTKLVDFYKNLGL